MILAEVAQGGQLSWGHLIAVGGPALTLFCGGLYVAWKAVRESVPCPSKQVLEDFRMQQLRQEEGFRAVAISLDKMGCAIRDQGESIVQASREHRESMQELFRIALTEDRK